VSQFLDISAALDARLATMASLPPVAWENDEYKPVKGTLYIQQTHLPGDTVGGTLGNQAAGGKDFHTGIYFLNIFAPAGDDTGKNTAYVMADNIANHFKPVTELTYNARLVRCVTVSRGAAITSDGWYQVPVRVQYQSFALKR
jgi:hypothetical protein